MYDNLLCHDIKRDMSNEGVVANKSGVQGVLGRREGAGEGQGCWGGGGEANKKIITNPKI